MPPTKVQPTTSRGGRKLSEETRAKLSATNKAKWAALTPEQQAAQLAKIGRKPKASTDPPPATSSSGGPRNPLDDAPRDRPGDRVSAPLEGHHRVAPPIFRVPDLPPIDMGGDGPAGDPAAGGIPEAEPSSVAGTPFGITAAEVGRLLELPFNVVSIRRGRHWKLLDEERDMVAEPLAEMLNEHAIAARALSIAGPYVTIIGGLGLILWVRLEEDQRRAERAAAHDGSTAGGRAPAADHGDRDGRARRDHLRAVDGHLNGFSTGPDAGQGAAATPAEDQVRPLVQDLRF